MASFFTDLAPNVIFNSDPTAVIDFMKSHKLLADSCNCTCCTKPMELVARPTTSDGFGWRCTNQRCQKRHTYRTIRTGSFFEKSKVTLNKWLYAIYLWSQESKVNTVVKQVDIGEKTVIQMYQYLRDVCSTKLLNTPIELGGPGVVVQIDESLFNHKSKYNRGRRPKKELWVFGLADTSFKPAITYMELVEKRDAATLLPIIEKAVKPGTIIYSDQWKAYCNIQRDLQLEHATVNHSVNFVDPETGVHTQAIESYWAKAKYKFKVMKGVSSDLLPNYLDERMWRDRWGSSKDNIFTNILAHISEQYPV
ncbi:uncharacterized protein [Mytilus edulis]|uniref:uncharacterized protein n=1 Tax=Mytilus edulis TaxID=6550 RepID=UPI0039F01C0B